MKQVFTLCAVALMAFSAWAAPKKGSARIVNPAASSFVQPQRSATRVDLSQVNESEDCGAMQCVEAAPVFKKAVAKNLSKKSVNFQKRFDCKKSLFEVESAPARVDANAFIPTVEQVALQVRMAKAVAAGQTVTLASSYIGSGEFVTGMDTTMGNEWAVRALISNDTAYFQQLTPFMPNSPQVVFGLIQADGTINVPYQVLGQVATYDVAFYGVTVSNKNLIALENAPLTVDGPYISTNVPGFAFGLFSTGTSDFLTYVSLYAGCSWMDASYNPYADANFVYTASAVSYSEFAQDQSDEWKGALTFGASGQFVNGEKVTLNTPVLGVDNATYTCEGVYNDGYITVSQQKIGVSEDYTLWLTGVSIGSDGKPVFESLRFKVEQEGHVLSLANEYAGVVECIESETFQADAVKYFYTLYEDITLFDDKASVYTNPLESVYYGYGESNFGGMLDWEMGVTCNASTGELSLSDIVYMEDIEGYRVQATYDAATKTLTIPCGQVVASGSGEYVIFEALDAAGSNWLNKVELKRDANGNFSAEGYVGLASSTSAVFSDDSFGGFYELLKPGAEWTKEHVDRGPVTVAGTDNLILNVDLLSNFYSWNKHYAMVAANANIAFQNYTAVDTYNKLSWSMDVYDEDDNVSALTSTSETFKVRTAPGNYGFPVLTASNNAGSTAYTVSGSSESENAYLFASGYSENFADEDAFSFLMRGRDDFKSASTVAPGNTTAKNNEVVKSYCYQGVPGAPLYFEGIDLVGRNYALTKESATMSCIIRACHRDYNHKTGKTKMTVGDTLYISTVLVKDAWVESYSSGNVLLGYIHFEDFSEIVDGESVPADYLQVNQEFLVEFAWEDNDSFQFLPISDDRAGEVTAPVNTYVGTATSEENGKFYTFDNACHDNVYVSYANAIYGYLDVKGDHVFTLPAEGGSVDVVVYPFMCANDGNGNATTSLWLAENSEPVTLMWEDEEYREQSWVKAEIVSENYAEGEDWCFTLRLTAEALPTGAPGRNLPIVFEQEGAILELEILQGEGAVSGIRLHQNAVTPRQLYNVAGQKTGANKGLLVGKQFKAVVR